MDQEEIGVGLVRGSMVLLSVFWHLTIRDKWLDPISRAMGIGGSDESRNLIL